MEFTTSLNDHFQNLSLLNSQTEPLSELEILKETSRVNLSKYFDREDVDDVETKLYSFSSRFRVMLDRLATEERILLAPFVDAPQDLGIKPHLSTIIDCYEDEDAKIGTLIDEYEELLFKSRQAKEKLFSDAPAIDSLNERLQKRSSGWKDRNPLSKLRSAGRAERESERKKQESEQQMRLDIQERTVRLEEARKALLNQQEAEYCLQRRLFLSVHSIPLLDNLEKSGVVNEQGLAYLLENQTGEDGNTSLGAIFEIPEKCKFLNNIHHELMTLKIFTSLADHAIEKMDVVLPNRAYLDPFNLFWPMSESQSAPSTLSKAGNSARGLGGSNERSLGLGESATGSSSSSDKYQLNSSITHHTNHLSFFAPAGKMIPIQSVDSRGFISSFYVDDRCGYSSTFQGQLTENYQVIHTGPGYQSRVPVLKDGKILLIAGDQYVLVRRDGSGDARVDQEFSNFTTLGNPATSRSTMKGNLITFHIHDHDPINSNNTTVSE